MQNRTADRRATMRLLAEAQAHELKVGLAKLGALPAHREIRPAETGLVMVRGRIGGDGAPFNLGEATVTRCAVQIASGQVGFGHALGRDPEKVKLAALCDALWQSPTYREAVALDVLAPIAERLARSLSKTRGETAATKVDFFTMVRGEDQW